MYKPVLLIEYSEATLSLDDKDLMVDVEFKVFTVVYWKINVYLDCL